MGSERIHVFIEDSCVHKGFICFMVSLYESLQIKSTYDSFHIFWYLADYNQELRCKSQPSCIPTKLANGRILWRSRGSLPRLYMA